MNVIEPLLPYVLTRKSSVLDAEMSIPILIARAERIGHKKAMDSIFHAGTEHGSSNLEEFIKAIIYTEP